eukprot:GHUV01017347.1.p1 GENE.GHUV01017347.1~~GHUV01017347.1.p1  ORF type:complete len:312 (+),score=74.41 GHUV01017347.1:75-1010(+)
MHATCRKVPLALLSASTKICLARNTQKLMSRALSGSWGQQTVHTLFEPSDATSISCDVVFFHGLQLGTYENAWEHTWQNKAGVLWPKDWLGQQDFPTARILSICYDSQAIRGSKDMNQIAKNLVQEVCMMAKVGQQRPVVLVGHSLGGLVLKKLAMEAQKEAGLQGSALAQCCKAFCSNLAGTFFFATPHGGAALGSVADRVFGAVKARGPVLDYLKVFSKQGAELNREFMLAYPTLNFMALVETKAYKGMHNYIEVDEDHISICKPDSKNANTYMVAVSDRYITLHMLAELTRLHMPLACQRHVCCRNAV